jgi:hypothetical protein
VRSKIAVNLTEDAMVLSSGIDQHKGIVASDLQP